LEYSFRILVHNPYGKLRNDGTLKSWASSDTNEILSETPTEAEY
jgi:hypothetical protein